MLISMGTKRCTKCEAEKSDDDFYVYKKTGKPWSKCKACHVSECVARAAADPEKHNARSKAWRNANTEKWQATVRSWNERHPDKVRRNYYWTRFRIEFDALWEACGGLCSSCQRPMKLTGKDPDSVCVDHDRSCCSGGKSCGNCVRGLLHRNCNLVLGYAKDDVEVLRAAAAYLERTRKS